MYKSAFSLGSRFIATAFVALLALKGYSIINFLLSSPDDFSVFAGSIVAIVLVFLVPLVTFVIWRPNESNSSQYRP